jgi:putative transposase
MFSEHDFQSWCQSLKLSEQAQSLISQIRASDPSRHVRSAAGNVSGRYPSRKMKRTIQFESHRTDFSVGCRWRKNRSFSSTGSTVT